MNPFSSLGLLTALLLPATSAAQAQVGTLAQMRETFNALDANKDGRLGPEERVTLDCQLTRGVDFDQDGFWSKGEFLLFHRQRLLAAKVKPAADLEAEATRILAARKAKTTERNTQRAKPQPPLEKLPQRPTPESRDAKPARGPGGR